MTGSIAAPCGGARAASMQARLPQTNLRTRGFPARGEAGPDAHSPARRVPLRTILLANAPGLPNLPPASTCLSSQIQHRPFSVKNLFLLAIVITLSVAAFKWNDLQEWYANYNAPKESAKAPDLAEVASGLTREYRNSLVFLEGKSGKGSGFVCEIGGRKFVITNQHVVAGNSGAAITRLDLSPIKTGQAGAAVGHDIMSFALFSDAKAMPLMSEVEKNAAIGDDVAVLGNANGDRVIKPVTGKLVGIGPDRVEVSAEFVPGNSGSPIVHIKSGKVIGVATYAKIRKVDSLTGKPKDAPEVKRFGYRIDKVKQWQPVNWPTYTADFQTMEKIEARTNDLVKLITSSQLNSIDYGDPAIRSPLERYANAAAGHGLIKTDQLSAWKDLTAALRTACNTDIEQAQRQLSYDYFRHQLADQQKLRSEFFKGFDEFLKRLPR